MENSRKTSVVIVHPDLGIGGAERLVLDVAIALSNNHHEVSFVTNHFNKTHAFQELKDDQFPVKVIGDWLPRSICAIIQVIFVKVKPDVYFVDQIPIAVPFIKWAVEKLYIIVIIQIYWEVLSGGTAMADVILVNSKYTASVFHNTFPEITQEIEILYPTISTFYQESITKLNPKPVNQLVPELEGAQNPFIFLSINRFHPAKKLELAIEALNALKNKLSEEVWSRVHLIIAGGYDPNSPINSSYFSKLVKLTETNELTNKITFLKSPADDLKADLLLSCNCLIYTPINEHFGIVPLEAMTAAKPVIACNSGGPCETVLDNITGYLCEPTPEGLSEGLYKIITNPELSKMGLLGKERLEKHFAYNTFSLHVNKVVENIVHGVEKSETNHVQTAIHESENLKQVDEAIIPETEDPQTNEVETVIYSCENPKTPDIETRAESNENLNNTPNCTKEIPKEIADPWFSPGNTTYLSTVESSTENVSDTSSNTESTTALNNSLEVNEEHSY
ncbi:hypothetical protein FQR65_LT05581 [Abscondita terminalis]|nr:hypothetical protein FQR65_LT05581 [Abscondita terminalis]